MAEMTPFQIGLGGALQAGGALLSRSSDKKERRRQEEYQTHMSNTAYQRAVADMRKAGLNPMLAFQQGGASTPQGGALPPAPNIGGAALEGVSKALQATNSATNLKTSIASNALQQSQIASDQLVQNAMGKEIAIDKVTGPAQIATTAKALKDKLTSSDLLPDVYTRDQEKNLSPTQRALLQELPSRNRRSIYESHIPKHRSSKRKTSTYTPRSTNF